MIDPSTEKYVSLLTYRKDGRGVRTPVWITPAAVARAYVYTNRTSGKVKRIRNNPCVRIAPCTMRGDLLGEWQEATARLVDNADERDRGLRTFVDKYGWQMRLALVVSRLSGRYRERALIEITL
jgi:PPOX class probable F420-dependent enzyme